MAQRILTLIRDNDLVYVAFIVGWFVCWVIVMELVDRRRRSRL